MTDFHTPEYPVTAGQKSPHSPDIHEYCRPIY